MKLDASALSIALMISNISVIFVGIIMVVRGFFTGVDGDLDHLGFTTVAVHAEEMVKRQKSSRRGFGDDDDSNNKK